MSNAKTNPLSVFLNGLWDENPVFVLLLGMCPTLAVTGDLASSLTMGLSATFVLFCSNVVVSLIRNLLKPHIRILMFTLTISTFVTIVDLILKAYLPEMSAKLGPYIPLIIVNCLIICRAEACASKQKLGIAVLDALGMGLGFTLTLSALGIVREVLSYGTVLGFAIAPEGSLSIFGFALPVGAFITLGFMLGIVNIINRRNAKE
ncbi:electron transport complex subunit RsxE [Sedimentisphaera salicampi]|uniref:electron transport complex subunit RsxE n=1 Tax=Sedimentisphaera salicampi TaxID=1941349 RepID=UPI000B9B15A5|nr:electron transport complex subunit RsxE [Sedimentisphaera salicampi]OXU16001.1 Nitrogen fixation protein RnfE [Sedimentisphaera salicampi]